MESHFSVSQSLQASVILQQQQQHLTKAQRKQQQKQHHEEKPLNFWQQLKLTAALFGVESSTAFEQVYTYLSLQYLGVPVALMSVNGIAAGLSAVVLILVVGNLIDRGSNPKRRKLFALVFGLLLLITGCLLIISACGIMIVERQRSSNEASDFSDLNMTTFIHGDKFSAITDLPIHADRLSLANGEELESLVTSLPPTQPEAYLPLTGVLGILGFTCLDIGFDVGNPMVRAFILEHSPSSQHSTILVTATQLASLAGLIMSCLGVFDVPGAIESALKVDGTAGTFIVMLTIILIIVVSFFGCSVWTGILLKKATLNKTVVTGCDTAKYKGIMPRLRSNSGWRKVISYSGSGFIQHHGDTHDTSVEHHKHIYRPSLERSKSSGYGQDKEESFRLRSARGQDILNSIDELVITDDKAPLLFKSSKNNVNDYLSFSLSVTSIADAEIHPIIPYPRPSLPTDALGFSQSHSILEGIPEHPNSINPKNTSPSVSEICNDESVNGLKDTSSRLESGLHLDKFLGNIDETEASSSLRVEAKAPSTVESEDRRGPHRSPGHHKVNRYNNTARENTSSSLPSQTPLLNKRLVILIFSTAFSVGAMIGIIMYSPNAVTLGIYRGDPTAELGTPENLSYRRGLRTAAMGNVVFYISYFLSSALNNKSFKILGEKVYYLVCHGLLVIAAAALLFTQRVEAYYVAMAAVGPFRTCIFTLPYVLANQFTEPTAGEISADSNRLGRVTSTIGSTLPCTYIVMSSLLGPLIDATGNVWVPLIWTCIGSTLSMAVFSLLFCIKD